VGCNFSSKILGGTILMASVLYISYDGMTDNLGQSQVIPYLIGLQKKGYAIHILSCEKPLMFAERKEFIGKLLQDNKLEWHPIQYTASPPVLSTLKDIKNLKKTASQLVQDYSIELLHCRSYISAGVGEFIQSKFSIPWIFDMRGFYADERVEGGIWKQTNLVFKAVYKHFKKKEKSFISTASHIISLTQAGKTEIETWPVHIQTKTPISVIPCCADLNHFCCDSLSPEIKLATRKELNVSEDAFVLSYLGSFGTWYMTEEMFDFFAELYKRNASSIFLCITPDNKEWLEELAAKRGVPASALRIFKANREDVPLYASISNWSLFFIKPVYSKTASSPTKMGELLGLGIPLVCNDNVGDVGDIMRASSIGELVSEYTPEAYNKVIDVILQPITIKQETLKDVACNVYSLEMGVEKYSEVYKAILNN